LGLLREGEGVAARVLENLGADQTNIRTQASIMSSSIPFMYFYYIRTCFHFSFENMFLCVNLVLHLTKTGYSHGW